MSIKVLIADDHHIFRHGLIQIIEADSSFGVVAEIEDGLEALKKTRELKPDIVILDISMPTMTGLEVAKKIQKEKIDVAVIILTMHTGRKYFQEAMDYGVKGYVLKKNTIEDLKTALKEVSVGKYFISPLLAGYHNKGNKEGKSFKESFAVNDLSRAEKRILKLIAGNKTSKEIAHSLCISFRTVQNQRARICKKLEIKGMNALLHFAIENKSTF